jgi:hypothetical protein
VREMRKVLEEREFDLGTDLAIEVLLESHEDMPELFAGWRWVGPERVESEFDR